MARVQPEGETPWVVTTPEERDRADREAIHRAFAADLEGRGIELTFSSVSGAKLAEFRFVPPPELPEVSMTAIPVGSPELPPSVVEIVGAMERLTGRHAVRVVPK